MAQTLADACLGEADAYTWIKLHTGAPGAAGTSNAAGNTTRKQVTWGSPSSGSGTRQVANTGAVQWDDVGTAEDYTHFSAWSLESAGAFGFSGTITANAMSVGDDAVAAIGAFVASFPVAS
jgi:hypothetical protein